MKKQVETVESSEILKNIAQASLLKAQELAILVQVATELKEFSPEFNVIKFLKDGKL
jgi:hypothetical protein